MVLSAGIGISWCVRACRHQLILGLDSLTVAQLTDMARHALVHASRRRMRRDRTRLGLVGADVVFPPDGFGVLPPGRHGTPWHS